VGKKRQKTCREREGRRGGKRKKGVGVNGDDEIISTVAGDRLEGKKKRRKAHQPNAHYHAKKTTSYWGKEGKEKKKEERSIAFGIYRLTLLHGQKEKKKEGVELFYNLFQERRSRRRRGENKKKKPDATASCPANLAKGEKEKRRIALRASPAQETQGHTKVREDRIYLLGAGI